MRQAKDQRLISICLCDEVAFCLEAGLLEFFNTLTDVLREAIKVLCQVSDALLFGLELFLDWAVDVRQVDRCILLLRRPVFCTSLQVLQIGFEIKIGLMCF